MRNRLKPTEGIEMLAGRERIFPALLEMFQERPLAGWGPVNNQYEVALRIGERNRSSRGAHNLILELLTATGLLGVTFFLIGLWHCITAAITARHGIHGSLPAALLAAQLAANMSGNYIAVKFFWLVLALALASASQVGAGSRTTVFTPARDPARVRVLEGRG
jgi:O-antigen ligase